MSLLVQFDNHPQWLWNPLLFSLKVFSSVHFHPLTDFWLTFSFPYHRVTEGEKQEKSPRPMGTKTLCSETVCMQLYIPAVQKWQQSLSILIHPITSIHWWMFCFLTITTPNWGAALSSCLSNKIIRFNIIDVQSLSQVNIIHGHIFLITSPCLWNMILYPFPNTYFPSYKREFSARLCSPKAYLPRSFWFPNDTWRESSQIDPNKMR